jgi:hypothetical protein
MTQHPIDLLPSSLFAQAQAGARAGRTIGVAVGCLAIVIAATAHSHFMRREALDRLEAIEAQARLVRDAEQTEAKMREAIRAYTEQIDRYHGVALPLQVSHVIATIANAMPASITLDRIDLIAGLDRRPRTSRSSTVAAEDAPRRLTGELAGFGATDADVAELVGVLSEREPFRAVSLDLSRHRVVRERNAREFRVSFEIELDCLYENRAELAAMTEDTDDQ